MCIDLYVDKVLVYTDCLPSPDAPLAPHPAPASHVVAHIPSPVTPSPTPELADVPSPSSSDFYYTPSSSKNSPVITPSTTDTDSVLETPSATATINTTMSPSSSNSSNMSLPSNDSNTAYIEDHTAALTIVIVVSSLVLLLCAFACRKRCKKKVKPVHVKKKPQCTKPCCKCSRCCEKNAPLPNKPTISTHTHTYVNQLPEESVDSIQGTPSAPALSLPPTPRNSRQL